MTHCGDSLNIQTESIIQKFKKYQCRSSQTTIAPQHRFAFHCAHVRIDVRSLHGYGHGDIRDHCRHVNDRLHCVNVCREPLRRENVHGRHVPGSRGHDPHIVQDSFNRIMDLVNFYSWYSTQNQDFPTLTCCFQLNHQKDFDPFDFRLGWPGWRSAAGR